MYIMYFVQKKNRCKNGTCTSYTCQYCCFATSSSMHTQTKSAKTVYANAFKNNITKRGSGGNSYAGYLARRVGNIKCKCNEKCEKE